MSPVKLSKPITAHGVEVSEIELREPLTEDVIEIGQPFLILMRDGNDTAIELRQNVIAKYISKLGAIPMSSVKALSIKDFTTCSAVVMGFFGQGDTETPPI